MKKIVSVFHKYTIDEVMDALGIKVKKGFGIDVVDYNQETDELMIIISDDMSEFEEE